MPVAPTITGGIRVFCGSPPACVIASPRYRQFALALIASYHAHRSPLRIGILKKATLEMHDGAEHVGLRAIHRRILVDERDQAARPGAEIIALMQINPTLVRRNLLNDASVDGALGPGKINPFHAAQRSSGFFPRSLYQLGRQ